MKLRIDEDRCSGCGICIKICPQKVFDIKTTGNRKLPILVAEEKCSRCRTCEEKCPDGAIEIHEGMLKVKPPDAYPPEDGHFLRGNDYSPVAVAALLDSPYGEVPLDVENIVRDAIESGAALAGTLQTANIGIEKVVSNIVANPNIRYLIVCGRELAGHMPGDALNALINNGLDSNRRIVQTIGLKPYLLNISMEAVDRFRKQIAIVDLRGAVDTDTVKKAVCACYQEKPTVFQQYKLYDVGAYTDAPICQRIKWRITRFDLLDEDEIQYLLDEVSAGKRAPGAVNGS
jgi:tetrahydromethanopterin S-methyltransferase subunit A